MQSQINNLEKDIKNITIVFVIITLSLTYILIDLSEKVEENETDIYLMQMSDNYINHNITEERIHNFTDKDIKYQCMYSVVSFKFINRCINDFKKYRNESE